MGYYERVATPGLGEESYTELRYFVTQVANKPRSFSMRERDIRRANLRRFPYHFLSAALAAKSEFSSSAVTIDIHLRVQPSIGVYGRIRRVSPGVDLDFNRDIRRRGVEILNLSKCLRI
jgi:hypothetical protein